MNYYCMVLLVLWLCRLLQAGEEVTCQSLLSGSSCSKLSDGARCEPDAISSCYSKATVDINENVDNRDTVEQCKYKSGNYFCSPSSSQSGSGEPADVLTGINARAVSFDPEYYSVNVSWTISSISDYYDGYMVKLYERRKGRWPQVKRCVCILDLNITNFDFLYLQYDNLDEDMYVKAIPYPVLPGIGDNFAESTEEEARPKGCADAFVGNDSVCNVKRYRAAGNITVQSSVTCNNTKELHISWEHPSVSSGGPHPPSYYLFIRDSNLKRHTFKVDNATSVVLGNLDASLEYVAKLQAYGKCSGLGDLYVSLEKLGCGKTFGARESLSLDKCDITSSLPAATPTAVPQTPAGDKEEASTLL